MNYLLSIFIGLALGFLIPKVFKTIKISNIASLSIGGASALAAFHVIAFTGIFPKGILGVLLSSVAGVTLAFLNLKQYYQPKFPTISVVVRIFLGLFMLSSGIMMLMVNPQPGESLPGSDNTTKVYMFLQAVIDSGFLWQWIFIFKIINGILLLIPRTSTIGIIAALPYYANLMIFTSTIANLWLFLSIPAIIATVYLIYAYWDNYKYILKK